ncbi:MAG TPA: class I tRNA ligase family protein [Candidatus Paceibacterota bacterium]|nr:class I tRNA ligase family protein [Candidatus Paceibacterota bacterium]
MEEEMKNKAKTEAKTEPKTKGKLVEIEEKVLRTWAEKETFQKSLDRQGPNGAPAKEFVFYDGPPFANGLPHYGHMLASFIKDAVPRYKTMRGYHVARRWGWDCHGLPVENLVEKELGLQTKKDIVDYGLEKFNDVARESVLRYANDWRQIIPRTGRWVDMEDDYRTMDAAYTQSVWWAFKTLYDKGLVYEGFKAMQICPRCETTLSNFEVNQGYKDIADISVFVRFKVVGKENMFFLAWTTTPWTLPGNVALAVGPDIDYAVVEHAGASYILAQDRVSEVFAGKEHSIGKVEKGSTLVGARYKPVFPYYANDSVKNSENAWKVYPADFVTTTDGTGIVHIAPAFGEDDLKLGQANNLPILHHVATNGTFKPEVTDFAGQPVKPKGEGPNDHQKADVEIIKYLARHGHLFEKKKIIHSYPHCWRCDTPLLNYATSSWFVRVASFKDKLVAANKKVSWVPADIRDGRFGKWLEGARDWAISRSRFWGAPIPVWKGVDSGRLYPVGTIEDLKELIRKSGNAYALVRHGESLANAQGVSNSRIELSKRYPLTEKGKGEIAIVAKQLAREGVDVIVASDFHRTKETARLIAAACGIAENQVVYDERLREYDVGPDREGKLWADTDRQVRTHGLYPGMETPAHLKKRVFEALYDIDRRYQGKRVVIVSHGSPLNTMIHGIGETASSDKVLHDERRYFQKTGEMHRLEFVRLPHNRDFDLDLHRPYIDAIECVAPDGERLVRVPEVFDCWFESGSMPYGEACYAGKAQPHFDPKGGLFKRTKGFPADFIAEGLDQTRGWFYSMMVLGVGLFGQSPYKNVIVNGIVLAEDGEKMSKRLKNYPDPMEVIGRYGVDSLRYYLLSSPVVAAQDLCFSEKGVDEVSKKLLQRLDNVLAFYEMYEEKEEEGTKNTKSTGDTKSTGGEGNVLDRWIVARLRETAAAVTAGMEAYQLDKASRPLMSFVDDLSTWYLRRSRDRFKSDDREDKAAALATTRQVLQGFALIAAPFTPFYAEYLYGKTRRAADPESVHLADWPKALPVDGQVVAAMEQARKLVTLALQERSKANIKVRQPLAKLSIRAALAPEFLAVVKDEVNVKEVVVDESLSADTLLDTIVTESLRKEGAARDLIRSIQELRKAENLTVGDRVVLLLDADEKAKELVRAYATEIRRVTLVTGVEYAHLPHAPEIGIEEYRFRIALKK